MKHQLLERRVQVVGLSETKAGTRFVDDTVFNFSIHTERERRGVRLAQDSHTNNQIENRK